MPKTSDEAAITAYLSEQFEAMYAQARTRFGKSIQAFWMNEAPGCPGCGNEIGLMEMDGEKALSLNAFIYRECGVLIGYALCAVCGEKVMKAGKVNPFRQIPLHGTIETNLVEAYRSYLNQLDA